MASSSYLVASDDLEMLAGTIEDKFEVSGPLKFPTDFIDAITDYKPSLQDKIIYFPDSINITADNGYDGLNEVVIPALSVLSNIQLVITQLSVSFSTVNLTTINSSAYFSNNDIVAVQFPGCVTIANGGSYSQKEGPYWFYYGFGAFCKCKNLKIGAFPNCTTIGSSAFANCTSLQSVSFPKCTIIGSYAFTGCPMLEEVYFPKSPTVAYDMFWDCYSLRVASFPVCTNVQSYAFAYCSRLESLYLLASTVATLADVNAFGNAAMSTSEYLGYFGSIYVPSSLVNAYKTATNWATYADRIVGI